MFGWSYRLQPFFTLRWNILIIGCFVCGIPVLYTFLPCHLISSENRSPSLFGNLCILRVIFHYSSFNQLSLHMLRIMRCHLQYFMTLIALARAFSPSTQIPSRFVFQNPYIITLLFWLLGQNLGFHVDSKEASRVQGPREESRGLAKSVYIWILHHPKTPKMN